MNYATIKKFDIANGPGVRVSLFVSGCRHRCPECFNREAWDFAYGEEFTPAVGDEIIAAAGASHIAGLSLLGGEPFEAENQSELLALTESFRRAYPHKTVWCYTGYLFEDIVSGNVGAPEVAPGLLKNIDTLVDGRFIEALKSPSLLFRGSSNQRIIDVKRSLEAGSVVLMDGVWERKMGSGDIDE